MRIAINGTGRIGKQILKIALEKKLNVVAVNNTSGPEPLAYLLKYDTVYGNYNKKIKVGKNFIKVDNKKILILTERDPENLPWEKLKVDTVVEATGLFKNKEAASKHLKAGAKRVVITAPSDDADITVVLGINEKKIKKSHKIISMASCTTNCLSPLAKVLNDNFKIKKGFMTTVHGYTSTQSLSDSSHKKPRRGRAAAANIIPTTTGATIATEKVIPKLKGKIDGLAMRVPVLNGSIVDFVVELQKNVTTKKVNSALKKASRGKLKGILSYSEDPLVSSDIIGNPHSSIIDGLSTQVLGKNMVKVLSWYDNEFGYSNRIVELLKKLK
jgi:glyceraldehyde 3-phosphate dehydrogenase